MQSGICLHTIELLVVISIISVLVALLMPALRYAKDQAQTAQCMSNLRQIGLAFEMYGQERNHYPWGYELTNDWSYSIQPYLQKQSGLTYGTSSHNLRSSIIQCPARTFKSTNIVSCYGVHDRIFGNMDGGSTYNTTPPYPRAYPWTERPSEVMIACDADQVQSVLGGEARATIRYASIGMDYDPATADVVVAWGDNLDNPPGSHSDMRWRHGKNSRANFLFADGHVQSIEMHQLRRKNQSITPP